ncbi:hypothetical protein BGX34_000209 [Mortierella sp. NVP85]|nr:hypothetical protein BGX34_000209 [Mortierella sp. NVP85]
MIFLKAKTERSTVLTRSRIRMGSRSSIIRFKEVEINEEHRKGSTMNWQERPQEEQDALVAARAVDATKVAKAIIIG